MKTIFFFFFAWNVCITADSNAGIVLLPKKIATDTTDLPECIKKLSRPGSKGIRSFNGGLQYRNMHRLQNGTILYAFRNEASIGCNSNEPAGTKYFNDSCRLVAKFPSHFSIKQAFKPFIADCYQPEDFEESKTGDYPLYFAELEKKKNEKAAVKETVADPFPNEKTFTIEKAATSFFPFVPGDLIKISTQKGLSHYRNGKLVNSYKIIPHKPSLK